MDPILSPLASYGVLGIVVLMMAYVIRLLDARLTERAKAIEALHERIAAGTKDYHTLTLDLMRAIDKTAARDEQVMHAINRNTEAIINRARTGTSGSVPATRGRDGNP